MKKVIIILFSLIALCAIILFFFFKDKPTPQAEKKEKTKVIQQEKLKLILEPTQNYDKSRYKKVEDYKEAVPLDETLKNTKQKDFDVNVDIDINKKEKSLDGVELNIQKKF